MCQSVGCVCSFDQLHFRDSIPLAFYSWPSINECTILLRCSVFVVVPSQNSFHPFLSTQNNFRIGKSQVMQLVRKFVSIPSPVHWYWNHIERILCKQKRSKTKGMRMKVINENEERDEEAADEKLANKERNYANIYVEQLH